MRKWPNFDISFRVGFCELALCTPKTLLNECDSDQISISLFFCIDNSVNLPKKIEITSPLRSVIAGWNLYSFAFDGSITNSINNTSIPRLFYLLSQVYMSIILPFVLALCCIRSVRKLSYFSTFANFLCLAGLIIVFAQLLQDIPSIDSVPAIETDYTRWPLFLATTIYTFEVSGGMSSMG